MIDITPSPAPFHIGPIYLYGVMYAIGIAAAYFLATAEAKRRGQDPDVVANGMIVVAVAALIGGRAYHVIDQWNTIYVHDPIRIFLPPYTGLGIYGGVATGLLAIIWYTRRLHLPFWTWIDIAAPAVLLTQDIARWGNFFNQELYGPPTTLPWGIAIQCAYRVPEFACPPGSDPSATLGQHFIPLFLYESVLSFLGVGVLLWLARRSRLPLRPGDIAMGYFIWYGVERFLLEFFRTGYNWTFFGIATAQVVASLFIVGALAVLVYRHRAGARVGDGEAERALDREGGAGGGWAPDGTEPVGQPPG